MNVIEQFNYTGTQCIHLEYQFKRCRIIFLSVVWGVLLYLGYKGIYNIFTPLNFILLGVYLFFSCTYSVYAIWHKNEMVIRYVHCSTIWFFYDNNQLIISILPADSEYSSSISLYKLHNEFIKSIHWCYDVSAYVIRYDLLKDGQIDLHEQLPETFISEFPFFIYCPIDQAKRINDIIPSFLGCFVKKNNLEDVVEYLPKTISL